MITIVRNEYPVYDEDANFIGIIKLNMDFKNKEFIRLPIMLGGSLKLPKPELDHPIMTKQIVLKKISINKLSYFEVDLLKESSRVIKSFLSNLDYVSAFYGG